MARQQMRDLQAMDRAVALVRIGRLRRAFVDDNRMQYRRLLDGLQDGVGEPQGQRPVIARRNIHWPQTRRTSANEPMSGRAFVCAGLPGRH